MRVSVNENTPSCELVRSIQALLSEKKEINAENLWIKTQNKDILYLYMDLLNRIDVDIYKINDISSDQDRGIDGDFKL